MPIVFQGEQRTDEWRMARLGMATASKFDAVMADPKTAARRNYITDIALEMVTKVPREDDLGWNRHVKNGIEREPRAQMLYEMTTGLELEQVAFIRHDVLECGCSPDGLIGEDGGAEFKCVTPSVHLGYLRLPGMPADYRWQVQGSMFVTGRRWWDFVSYCPDFPEPLQLHIVRVKRDEALIAKLQDGLETFLAEVRITAREIRDLVAARAPQKQAA